MNLVKPFLFAVLLTLAAFTCITYVACKDACKGVACLNGGSCQDGKCVCPSGYTGANCEKTLCTGIDCKNGGTCKDGKCQCPAGYEGSLCETAMAEKFYGTWTGTIKYQDGSSFSATYVIAKGTSYLDVSIKETVVVGVPSTITLVGTVSDTKTLNMAKQAVSSTVMVEGKITIDGNKITVDKTVTDALNGTSTTQSVCTKQ